MKTKKITAVIGINEGYGHNNESSLNAVELVSLLWQKTALTVFESCGIYVSCVATLASTVYNESWGCPKGGEVTVRIETSANPEFIKNIDQWQEIVISIISQLKEDLKQSTVAVEVSEIDFIYLN